MKKIHTWQAGRGQDFWLQPEIGYEIADSRYVLFERYGTLIIARVIAKYQVAPQGWWSFEEEDVLLMEHLEEGISLEDIEKYPENYLAEIIL